MTADCRPLNYAGLTLQSARFHESLVRMQSTAELWRKAQKARRRGVWTTVEDCDLSERETDEMLDRLDMAQ